MNKIQDAIDKLVDFPLVEAPVSSVYEIDTDYRFLVSGNYLAFYRAHEDSVYIDRVLYGKRDCLAILLHGLPKQDED